MVIEKSSDFQKDDEVVILNAEITEGGCLEKDGSCDFQKNMCGYTKVKKSPDAWSRIKPNEASQKGRRYPDVDKTIGSGEDGMVWMSIPGH